MNDRVAALAVSGTNLYAGGRFTTAAGANAIYIAKLDGSAWSALGSGMGSYVGSLAVSGTNLYAGGASPRRAGRQRNRQVGRQRLVGLGRRGEHGSSRLGGLGAGGLTEQGICSSGKPSLWPGPTRRPTSPRVILVPERPRRSQTHPRLKRRREVARCIWQ